MATIRETILEYPSIEDMESFLDKVVFVKRGINPEAECTTENMKQVGLCVADTYAMLVNSQDFSENKLSITHQMCLRDRYDSSPGNNTAQGNTYHHESWLDKEALCFS